MVQTLECINCGWWYVPRKDGAKCPKCRKDPMKIAPGRGWKKGMWKDKKGRWSKP